MIRAWEEHGPDFFSKLQKSIVTQAVSMLKPGGMLLYSTCTFDSRENEQIIEYLLDSCPNLEICEMEGYEGFCKGRPEFTESKHADFQKTVRIFPHRMEGEGHFLALLKKKRSGDSGKAESCQKSFPSSGNRNKGKGRYKIPEELGNFLQTLAWKIDKDRLELREGQVYYMPEGLPNLQGIRFLRSGLLLGEVKKNRFEPSQALAMCLKKEEYGKTLNFSVEDVRVIRYLKGETLDVEDLVSPKEKGWYLVCVDDYPLGFGKLSAQTLKNKYLPGWRWVS